VTSIERSSDRYTRDVAREQELCAKIRASGWKTKSPKAKAIQTWIEYQCIATFPVTKMLHVCPLLVLTPNNNMGEGRGIAQAVSRRLPTAATRVRSQVVMWDLW
jgi:hypothetical protein